MALREYINKEVKKASVFSVLANETADIGGVEQLSIGVRYLCFAKDDNLLIFEEFLGYVPLLQELEAETILETIQQFLNVCDLDLNKLMGEGYDGCSTMDGQIAEGQALIRKKHPMAIFFHCASHALNLVINDIHNVAVFGMLLQERKKL